MIKSTRKKMKSANSLQPIIIALILVLAVVTSLSFKYYLYESDDFVGNILIEAHGTVLDILIFGIVFTFINITRNKRLEIQRFKEEIDDFRHWNEQGASYRIAGILRRLNKYKIDHLDLSYCNLSNAKLKNVYLQYATFEKASLQEADLAYAELKNANLRFTNLLRADLRIANLQDADLRVANLVGANLRITNFKGANLFNADLQDADMKTANLEGCDLTTTNLQNADLKSANMENTDLTGAKLQKADLRSAKLTNSNLNGANLEGVILGDYVTMVEVVGDSNVIKGSQNYYQLGDVASLTNAIMPDGTKFDENWESIIKTDFEKYNNKLKNK